MHNSFGVCVCYGLTHRNEYLDHPQRRINVFVLHAGSELSRNLSLIDDVAQRLAFNQLERKINLALRINPKIMDRNNIRMLQLSGDLGFLHKTQNGIFRARF